MLPLTLMACEPPPDPGALRGTNTPKDATWIMTYNVNFERPEGDTVDAIATADADVVFLQETTAQWEQLIRKRLSARYPHMAFRPSDPDGGMAVLSRRPFIEKQWRPSPVGSFPAWCLQVDTAIGRLDVLHLHLHPPLHDDRLLPGYFMTGELRLAEIQDHLSCFDGLPDIALGDFNEETGDAVRSLLNQGMAEAQAAFPPVARTWRWPTMVGEIDGRPDHIFYGTDLDVAAVQVMQSGASDHRPLRAAIVSRHEASQ